MKMKEIFPNPSNGIFNYINIENAGLLNKNYLNILYHTNNSNKSISPLLENFVVDNAISNDNLSLIGHTIEEIYSNKWKALYKTITLSYNPIENYNMTENETINTDIANNESSTLNSTNNSTSKNTSSTNQTDTSTIENASNTDMQTYGFNSATAVDKDKNSSTENSTNNSTLSNENETNITNNNTQNSENTSTLSASNDTIRELKRSGNIGVTTTQQMLEQERMLWDWNYYNTVFKDIDNLLTLLIYE